MQLNKLLKILAIIHLAMAMGLIIFTGFAYWNNPDFVASMNPNDSFTYLVPTMAAAGYFASKYLFQKRMDTLDRNDGIQNKIVRYQAAALIQYACLEGPALLALIGYYLKGNMLYLVIAFCLIAYFLSQRPSRKKVLNDLKLSLEERKELDIKN